MLLNPEDGVNQLAVVQPPVHTVTEGELVPATKVVGLNVTLSALYKPTETVEAPYPLPFMGSLKLVMVKGHVLLA